MVMLSVDTPGRLPGCSLVAGEMLLYGKPFSPSPHVILPGFVCFLWACAARPGSLCPPVADRGCSGRVHPVGAPSHQLPSHLALRSQHLLRGCDLHLGLASERLPWSLCLKALALFSAASLFSESDKMHREGWDRSLQSSSRDCQVMAFC